MIAPRPSLCLAALTLLALAAAGPAWPAPPPPSGPPADVGGPSPTGQPKTYTIDARPFAILGYGSIRFGMTPSEVQTAAGKLFGPATEKALTPTAVEAGFTALEADGVPIPEIGAARVIFVFDSGRLRAVNLEQVASKAATAAERQTLIDHAARVVAGIKGLHWPLFNVDVGHPVGANDLLVFAGLDDLGNGVQVSLIGVDYTYPDKTGAMRTSSRAAGPAALRILIEQDLQDRSHLGLGDFASSGADSTQISGFRSAAFGMAQTEVLKAIAKDFKVEGKGVEHLTNSKEHTQILTATLPRLDPGPCPAVISYIFDDAHGKLIAINVQWAYPANANAYQRAAIMRAGERLANYFKALPVQPASVLPTGAAGPQTVRFYAARDRQGDQVTVEADGVDIRLEDSSKAQPAQGPAMLRIAYDAQGDAAQKRDGR